MMTMADVRYRISISNVPTKSDAVVAAEVAAVDISPVLSERQREFTICNDTTAIGPAGTVIRTIVCELSAEFESHFPTENDQLHALYGAFKNRFQAMLPCRVIESVDIGAFCP
jgi:hypothetical protein